MKLSGWGRYPILETQCEAPRNEERLRQIVKSGDELVARGNGRAYGDSAVGQTRTVQMRHFNRMLAFEPQIGQLVAEAGVLLDDVIETFLPRGWFPFVTPGTKFVTLGGMVAADVHGKNHHRDGSFSGFVEWLDVMGSDGAVRRCSRNENSELFEWTLGGMGLTGVIMRLAFRLRPVETGWIRQTTIAAPDLDAVIAALGGSQNASYSVAWIDCLAQGSRLGRALVFLGEHALLAELPPAYRDRPFEVANSQRFSFPFNLPTGALNGFSIRAFNAVYYWNGRRKIGQQLVDWDSFFYPLDTILGWNRIYGRNGFTQFQCVIPLDRSTEGLRALLEVVSKAGSGSFLAVLKRFGAQDSRFSFPMEGYTLAMDFPINRRTLDLMSELERTAIQHGGRFYLAKDSYLSPHTLRASDARVEAFTSMRKETNLAANFQSAQSKRLGI